MKQSIGCDAHKKFCVFVSMNEQGEYGPVVQVSTEREQFRKYLAELPPGSRIALEAGGTYYWLVDEIVAAGHQAELAHPTTAKRRMRGRNKTDGEDARGLAMLLHNQTLPRVWIPPQPLRDQRSMLRLRMSLVGMRTGIKNRIHGTLAQYNLPSGCRDQFSEAGLNELSRRMPELPAVDAGDAGAASGDPGVCGHANQLVRATAGGDPGAERRAGPAEDNTLRGADPERGAGLGDRRGESLCPGGLLRQLRGVSAAGGAKRQSQGEHAEMPERL